jgi:hypothetical protein
MDQKNLPKAMINPFLAAKKSSDVMAAISEGDVIAHRPNWTADQARNFLLRNSRTIAVMMLQSGLTAMRQLLEEHNDN